MHQVIDGKSVYVVEFDTMPRMPVTGLTEGEMAYRMLTAGATMLRQPMTYAQILTDAIRTEIITEPGKYGLYSVPGTNNYEIYKIQE